MIGTNNMVMNLAAGVFAVLVGNEFGFQWDYDFPEQIDGFRIYHSSVSGQYQFGPEKAVATYPPETLESSKFKFPVGTHYFIIVAFDGDIESAPSNEVTAYIIPKPATPTNLLLK